MLCCVFIFNRYVASIPYSTGSYENGINNKQGSFTYGGAQEVSYPITDRNDQRQKLTETERSVTLYHNFLGSSI